MKPIFFSFFIFLVILSANTAHAETIHAYLLAPGEDSFPNDEIVLDNDETLELVPITVPETTETIGGQEVELTQEVKFIADDNSFVSLQNTALPNVIVAIPDNTIVKAPANWNGEITPPKLTTTIPISVSGFQTPRSVIVVGSPDVILVFDKAVTILLAGTTGQTAYKTPGSAQWILISGCTGTYENPNDPPVNGECSISNGVDTKILTYHFTEFTGLSESTSTGSTSGGSGNTGVGSPRIFGGSSGSSGGGYNVPTQSSQSIFPVWFDNVMDWYREGKISALEFLNSYQWIIKNVLK